MTPAPQQPRSGDQPISRPFSSAAIQRAPFATITALRPGTKRTDAATKRAHGQAAAITASSPASATIPNPHRRDPPTAGSFLQDFRTPSAPETLKALRQSGSEQIAR